MFQRKQDYRHLIVPLTLFWLSAWFPFTSTSWVLTFFCLAVVATSVAIVRGGDRNGRGNAFLRQLLIVIACAILVTGTAVTLLVFALGPSAGGYIVLYFVLGWAGLAFVYSGSLCRSLAASRRLRVGVVAVLFLSTWSWVSAIRMHRLAGLSDTPEQACILVSGSLSEYSPPSSFTEMRLPLVYSDRTGPTGTVVFDYHALAVVPDESPRVYNWSKRLMRFELLDLKRNRYLPKECPELSG